MDFTVRVTVVHDSAAQLYRAKIPAVPGAAGEHPDRSEAVRQAVTAAVVALQGWLESSPRPVGAVSRDLHTEVSDHESVHDYSIWATEASR